MASGSQNMTTYLAKHLIGDSTNVNWAGALLHSGTDGKTSAMDTWLFADDYGTAAAPWGIKHDQTNNKIVLVGNNVSSVWSRLDTGDTYILGKVGIDYNPETSGNAYKLYVNGDTYFNGSTTHKGQIYLNYEQDVGKNQNGSLIIGNKSGENIGIDSNEIMARNNSAVSTLYLNNEGGLVQIGSGGLSVSGQIYGTWLRIVNNSSNNSDDAMVYFENKSSSDWAMKINCTGYDYGLQITCAATAGNALSITGRQVIDGKIYISQPADRRDNGIVGSYDYTRAAAIWAMGASYQIAADGSGLGSLYGAAYAYQDQAYIGSKRLAGGHQFLWCENGGIDVALGSNGVWIKKNGGIYWDPYVESASDATDVTQIIQVASGVAGGTELRIQQANDSNDVINLVSPYYIYLNSKRAFTIYDSWLRINEDKGFSSGIYTGSSLIRTDNQLQVGSSGTNFYANSSGDGKFSRDLIVGRYLTVTSEASSWLDGQRYTRGIRMSDATNTGSYWPWIAQTNTGSAKWFSLGVLNNSFYIMGSTTSRTANSYDYCWRFDVSNGWAYGNFSNSDTVDGEHSSAFLHLTGGTMTGNISFSNSGTAFRGINYGTMGDNDQWRVGGAATASNAGYMEIATADDGNEPIYVRQYTGVFSSLTRTLTLLDGSGNSSFPGMVSFNSRSNSTQNYTTAAIWIREYNYGGTQSDNWSTAPRLGFHWSGRNAAQIGCASNGYLYECPGTGTSFYRLTYEGGTWSMNITGNAATATTATTASGANVLNINNTMSLSNCLQYIQTSSQTSNSDLPTSAWWHCIKMNHGNGGTYFKRVLAFNFWGQADIRTSTAEGDGATKAWKRVWCEGNSVTSAVWNDYAECRETQSGAPGQCVYELGDDTLAPTNERLQPAAGIISDTWGFSQGETETAKTPIAVAGRVLAYTYRCRDEYKPGDALCAAPGGTVDIMTRDEIREYPDRIVGIVSCIPDYEYWGAGEGSDRKPVEVDGRIWIKVQ